MTLLSAILLALLFASGLLIDERSPEARFGKYFILITSGIPLAYLITLLFA